jgi:hypothetical protein
MMDKMKARITVDDLPAGHWWEADGSCWEAIRCDPLTTGVHWRWRPMNAKALAKERPEGEMTQFVPLRNKERTNETE